MTEYAVYDPADGEILSIGRSPRALADLITSLGPYVVEGTASLSTDYAPAGVITARPTSGASIDVTEIVADGYTTATITGMPSGWAYEISNGEIGTTTGAAIAIIAGLAGTYVLTFTLWPYITETYTVYATDPDA